MILLTLSRGKGEETVRLQLPASPAEIGEAFASLDRISLDIIKGRIIKERHERREENHSERGELISTDVIETITNRMVFNILTPTGFRSLV